MAAVVVVVVVGAVVGSVGKGKVQRQRRTDGYGSSMG